MESEFRKRDLAHSHAPALRKSNQIDYSATSDRAYAAGRSHLALTTLFCDNKAIQKVEHSLLQD